jgi:glycosyltransferase involved in cell wall biosynthesis
MPRIGKHPLKLEKGIYAPQTFQKVNICTVTHIPMLAGYWENSLDVLKLFFESLYASTDIPFDLLVFDNASCPEAQNYLLEQQREGRIQFLHLSTYNLKKLGGMDALFSVAPGEFVAFADSDVYFLPGWLEESLRILEAFPEAGQVSALPTIDKARQYTGQTFSGVEKDSSLQVERGALVPEAYIEAHRVSIGREKETYLQNAGEREDVRITRDGISAYVSAQDFQFTTRREVIRQVLPLEVRRSEEYYDPIYSPVFEAKADELGWWRLSTTKYLIHHMGNQVPDLQKELAGIVEISGGEKKPPAQKTSTRWKKRVTQIHIIRAALKKIYAWAYSLLFES